DTDEMHPKARGLGGDTAVIHPAPPAAAELDHRERPSGEIDRAQRGSPLRDVGMPVCRYRDRFNLTGPAAENGGEKLRIDANAQEIGQIAWPGLEPLRGMTPHDCFRIKSRRVMKEGALGRCPGPARLLPILLRARELAPDVLVTCSGNFGPEV